MTIVGRPVNMI